MARDFLGTGWAYPVGTDYSGDIELSSAEGNIQQSIKLIIGTAKGERVMRPEFGCEIHEYVFAATDPATLSMIEDSVEEALLQWEPRIDVESVEASPDQENPNRVLVDIEYRVRKTNSTDNLVYPFFLTEGEE
ncbi:MAG: GPW/gp25 family protein [Haloarculaceae archaeon]